jgi:hypothetical protein
MATLMLDGASATASLGVGDIRGLQDLAGASATTSVSVGGLLRIQHLSGTSATTSASVGGILRAWLLHGTSRSTSTSRGLIHAPPLRFASPEDAAPYRLIVVDMWGTRYAELTHAIIGTATWTLNGPGALTFSLPLDDPQAALCTPIVREIQLWRGNQMLDWYVIVKPRKASGARLLDFQCPTLDWHLDNRVIAAPPAFLELLVNPDFEQGEAGWGMTWEPGSVPPVWPYHQVQTDRVETGNFALRMGGLPMIPGGDLLLAAGHKQHAVQSVIYANPEHAREAVPLKLSARCYIESFVSPAADGWGLYLEAFHPADGHSIGFAYSSINVKTATNTPEALASTPVGRWIDQSCELKIPADGIYYRVEVRLYPPGGLCVWDTVHLYADETVHFYDTDPATAILDLVDWAQSAVFNKSNLNIGTNCPPTGRSITRTYNMASRTKVGDAIREFATVADGVEWDIQTTPTTRVVTTYAPRKGADTDVVLALGANVVDYALEIDGDLLATRIIMQSGGHERSATNTAPLGGMVVERVLQARPGSSLGTLQAQADRALSRLQAINVPSLLMRPNVTTEMLDRVHVGDRVRLDVPCPIVNLLGVQARINQITLDATTDQLTYAPTLEA